MEIYKDDAELRAAAMERDGGRCVWPTCRPLPIPDPLELAHLRGKGMGGRPSARTLDNVAMLCRFHHDLLDGRSHSGLRREMGLLLAAYVNRPY